MVSVTEVRKWTTPVSPSVQTLQTQDSSDQDISVSSAELSGHIGESLPNRLPV